MGVEALDRDEMVQQLQDELLGLVKASVAFLLLGNEGLEIFSLLEEPEEEHRDNGVLECETFGHIIDVSHQVQQIPVVLIFVHSILIQFHRFIKIEVGFKHFLVVQEIFQGSLGDSPESKEVSEHLFALERDELVEPHLALVLVVLCGLLAALEGTEDHGAAPLR